MPVSRRVLSRVGCEPLSGAVSALNPPCLFERHPAIPARLTPNSELPGYTMQPPLVHPSGRRNT